MGTKWAELVVWWQHRHENGAWDYVYYGTVMVIMLGVACLATAGQDMNVVERMFVFGKLAVVGAILARMFRYGWLFTLALFMATIVVVVGIFFLIATFAVTPPKPPQPALSLLHPMSDGAELLDYRLGDPLNAPECPSVRETLQRSYRGPDGTPCFRHLTNARIGLPMGANEMVLVDRLDLARFGAFSTVRPVCIALRDARIVGVAAHVATAPGHNMRSDAIRSLQNTFQKAPDHVQWQAGPRSRSYYERDLWEDEHVRSAIYTWTVPPQRRSAGFVESFMVMESPQTPRPFASTRMDLRFDCPQIALDYSADSTAEVAGEDDMATEATHAR